MRILWLCNIMLPAIAEQLNMSYSVKEGWLTGTLERMIQEGSENRITLGICFPVAKEMQDFHQRMEFSGFPVEVYGFYENLGKAHEFDMGITGRLENIVNDFKPDMVHIFGTEFPHTLAMTMAFPYPNRILIGLQGILCRYAEEYLSHLPKHVVNHVTFRDFVKRDSIIEQQEKYIKRGINEKKALCNCGNVTGRTDFDKEMAARINPDAVYYHMNETMRPCFYTDKWELDYCRKHQIFVSQADYPLKGFHILLEALPKILLHFPDTEVVVAGNKIIKGNTLKDSIKISAYGKYLRSYIREWELEDKVAFLGNLSGEEIKEQYLLCHTFVSASILENSPNSVAEAMLLGTPVVAGKVGGIPSMITDNVDGLFFEDGDSDGLAECIIALWEDDELCHKLSTNASIRAQKVHDPQSNYKRLLEIYTDVIEKSN